MDSSDAEAVRGAELYEQSLVPALMAQFAALTLEAAKVKPGDRVLDVACGTGVVGRAALELVGPGGSVTGVDLNPAMLAVARRVAPSAEWLEASAQDLPFGEASFDVVTCQFGLMFFPDRVAALREMWRVLRPGGWLSLTVWDRIDQSPGYEVLEKIADRFGGRPAADEIRTPFALGEMDILLALAKQARIPNVRADWWGGNATFRSVEDLVDAELGSTPGLIDKAQFDAIVAEAKAALAPFLRPDGGVSFAIPALTLSAQK